MKGGRRVLENGALRIAAFALVLGVTGVGCDEPRAIHAPADLDFRGFQELYPVLLRDCAFHACHGGATRFFGVWGPGRERLDPHTAAFDGVTGAEASASFQRALSMVDGEHPDRSLLLRKPLAVAAGGSSHGGVDAFGRNVYRTVNDEGYRAIERWVLSSAKDAR